MQEAVLSVILVGSFIKLVIPEDENKSRSVPLALSIVSQSILMSPHNIISLLAFKQFLTSNKSSAERNSSTFDEGDL